MLMQQIYIMEAQELLVNQLAISLSKYFSTAFIVQKSVYDRVD